MMTTKGKCSILLFDGRSGTHDVWSRTGQKYQEETNVIEWDAVPSISESMELVDRVIHNLIKYKVTPISLAESLDEIMTREEEDGRSKI